jgi:manganese/zinc/iron transport system permease protein
VVTGIQAVGVVLMAAMLITPAAAARLWTHDILKMLMLSAMLGAASGIIGTYISYTAPTMPTGPWIVMIISMLAILSFFFAPKRGILAKQIEQRKLQQTLLEENLLKEFYHLGEKSGNIFQGYSVRELIEERYFPARTLKSGVRRLRRKGYIKQQNNKWQFTEAGWQKGKRVVKLHRLWELYLSTYLQIAPDHVHEDAETIEHIITPELEAKLEKLLHYPDTDPHQKAIPY